MSFAKPAQKTETVDEYSRLQCTHPGCTKRWAVHVGGEKPKCSEHQWTSTKKPSEKTIQAWYAKDEF